MNNTESLDPINLFFTQINLALFVVNLYKGIPVNFRSAAKDSFYKDLVLFYSTENVINYIRNSSAYLRYVS